MNANAPASVLETLANNQNSDVRWGVASNINASVCILEFLANDQDSFVRWAVAYNVNTPASVLETLADDENSDGRQDAIKLLAVKNSKIKQTSTRRSI